MRPLKKLEPYTLLFLRCGLGLVFIYHGYPKLFGDTSKFVEAFRNIGLPPYVVYVTGTIEFFGGVALALGLFTPIAALLLLLDMAAALWKYNFSEGIYAVREYELPLILGLAWLAWSWLPWEEAHSPSTASSSEAPPAWTQHPKTSLTKPQPTATDFAKSLPVLSYGLPLKTTALQGPRQAQ